MADGSGGSIYKSTDLGQTWVFQASAGVPLHGGIGYTNSISLIVGDNGTILKTTNGGVSWGAKPSGTNANLYAIVGGFPVLLVVGSGGTIIKSTDTGETWSPRSSGSVANLQAINLSWGNPNLALVVGDGGTVVESMDLGDTWCRLDGGTGVNLHGVVSLTNAVCFAGGAGGEFEESTNGGGPCLDPAAVNGPRLTPVGLVATVPYPNPSRTEARIILRAPEAATVQVDVFDLLGRQFAALGPRSIAAGQESELNLDVHNWPEGMYWVRLQGNGFKAANKLVVVK